MMSSLNTFKKRTVPLPALLSVAKAAKYIGLRTFLRHCSRSPSIFLHLQLIFNAKIIIYSITTFKIYKLGEPRGSV